MEKVILYSTHCPKCKVLSKKLSLKEISFNEIDCRENNEVISMLSEKGFRSMPVLQVDDKFYNFSQSIQWIGGQ